MKILKKNQVFIIVLAVMLMTIGYLNYDDSKITISDKENTYKEVALLGDATLVSNNYITEDINEDVNLVANDENVLESIQEEKPIISTDNKENSKENNDEINNQVGNDNSNISIKENISENIQENSKEENLQSETIQTNTSDTDYFIEAKIEQDTRYSQMIENYQKILNNSELPDVQKEIAVQEISTIEKTKNAIMISEKLIKAKGIEKCIIFVNSDSVNVIVEEKLEQNKVAQIQNIVSREIGVELENIHISEK